MEVIITHIQADFDALASMLAARLLHPKAVLVFPGSQEKGVREYLQHAPESIEDGILKLKSVDFASITRLILVDTRQSSRIGLFAEIVDRQDVEIIIYDHHPVSLDDIPGSNGYYDETGSNTALMTALLKEKGLQPPPEVATVMAMGIYEDTGSLLFPSTTPQDCRALADIIAWGADLSVVARMVARELVPEQIDLLDQLIKNARTIQIQGIEILITRGSSAGYVEDFAMLVHKLNSMFAVDAMFALAQMADRVYLVARSSLPQVNAADAAQAFGGGGHASASAASLKDHTLDQAENILLRTLNKITKPRITAADIMTFPVKGVYPETTIDETGDTLNKYHINAAIVKTRDERLLGYVTRQVVTRAQGHKLGSTKVKDYMIRDIHTVQPDAPVSEIRRLIIDGNQRLLPVVRDHRVMGVITRTDLMHAMHERMEKPEESHGRIQQKKTVHRLLEERLPRELYELVRRAGELAATMGLHVYLVGGIVRDMLLRNDNFDIDLVVEGDGISFARQFARLNQARISSHEKYKTAVITMPDGLHIDVATARLEYYQSPGSFPVVEESTLKLDLYRRDFTINTMAIALSPARFGELIDFFGAQRDIKEKQIRVLHSLSFVEDPSRILRAVRFEQRFGFSLGKQTNSLVHSAVSAGFLHNIPGKRIFHEMRQILEEEDPIRCMQRLRELGVLKAIHPGLNFNDPIQELCATVKETISWFRLLYTHERIRPWFLYVLATTDQLKPKLIVSITESLGFAAADVHDVLASKSKIFEIFRDFVSTPERSPAWVSGVLAGASLEEVLFTMSKTRSAEIKELISTYITTWRHYRPPVTGKDLIALGFKPGKELGDCLRLIRDKGLNGQIADYNAAMDVAKAMLPG